MAAGPGSPDLPKGRFGMRTSKRGESRSLGNASAVGREGSDMSRLGKSATAP